MPVQATSEWGRHVIYCFLCTKSRFCKGVAFTAGDVLPALTEWVPNIAVHWTLREMELALGILSDIEWVKGEKVGFIRALIADENEGKGQGFVINENLIPSEVRLGMEVGTFSSALILMLCTLDIK